MHRSTKIIKIKMIELGLSLDALAEEFGCRKSELSMLINRHPYRVYPQLQRKLCLRLGLNQEKLFGQPANNAANRRRTARKELAA